MSKLAPYKKENTVSNWTNIIAFSENSNFFVGLRKDGSENSNFLVGLRKDGTVITDFKSGVEPLDLSDWKDIVAIQANDSLVVGKKSDGTFVLGTNDFQLKKNFESIINRYVGG